MKKIKMHAKSSIIGTIKTTILSRVWRNIFLVVMIFIMHKFQGQVSEYQTKAIDIKSPQSYEMERFGNTPINLYSGSIDVNIPVCAIEIPGTSENFNIKLAYNSSGFIPAKQSNYVGHDWFLNYGGSITRTIKNIPDDVRHFENQNVLIDGGGYLVGARAATGLGLTNQNVFDIQYPRALLSINPPPYHYFPYLSPEQKIGQFYELEPDKFNFNFMGVSGYFYIGIDLKPIAVSNDPNLKIDITGVATQTDPNNGCKPDFSQIIITDGKGNKYYFGGDPDNLEVSYDLGLLAQTPQTPVYNMKIMSWYLNKVEYVNGRNIVIKNKQYGPEWTTFCHGNSFPPRDISEDSSKGLKQFFFDLNFYVSGKREIRPAKTGSNYYAGPEGNFKGTTSMNVVKKVFPEKITIDNAATITFSYTEFPAHTSYVDIYGSPYAYGYKSLKLNKISVYDNQNKEIKAVNFNYNRIKDYFFLSSVVDSNKKYSFDYYKTYNLPEHGTFGIDYWGYWNGKPENNHLTPNYVFNNSSLSADIVGDQRSPNPELCDVGLLRKIEYPTGGYSSFYYEPHLYSKTIWRDINSHFLQYLKTQPGTAGGARIKKIIEFDGNNHSTRDFTYDKDANNGSISAQSSGINNSFFTYVYLDYSQLYMFLNPGLVRIEPSEFINSINPNTYTNNPVNYSQVNEWVNNKLYKKYYFSDLENIPDALPDKEFKKDYVTPNVLDSYKNLTLQYVDNGYYRGKLLKTNYMGEQGTLLKTVENQYNIIKLQNQDQFVTWGSFEHIAYNRYYKINLNQQRLTSTITTDFLNGNTISTKTNYLYDTSLTNNLISEETTLPDQTNSKTMYKYARDISGNADLIQKNLTSIPLETTAYKNNIPISKTKLSYSTNWNGHTKILPKQVQSILINTIDSSSEISENEMVYDQYDTKGNLLQYHTKSNINVSIIWGYDQTLPLAKIEGIDYNSLVALPSMSNIITDLQAKSVADVDDSTEQTLNEALNNFRKNQSLTNYKITTYTHNPLIGVSSITPSTGIKEIYKYNTTTNKLEKIVSSDNTLLKEYHYKFKQPTIGLFYNDEISNYFIKNNCSTGLAGERYLYVVPEQKYNSTVSKHDANLKALADLNSNGQSQANLYGNCMPVTCAFNPSEAIPYWTIAVSKSSTGTVQFTFDGVFIADDIPIKNLLLQGVKVGKINGSCVPTIQRYSEIISRNRVWYVSVETNGDVFLKFLYETAANTPSSVVNFTFTYDLYHYNSEQKMNFTKNNCPAGTSAASSYTYIVPAKTYMSEISVDDANLQALNEINANGQNTANANSLCLFFNTVKSQTFTKNCPPGGVVSYTYIVPEKTYSSEISQIDADQKALDDINANGQIKTNAIPCFYNVEKSEVFTKNCGTGAVSNTYNYIVPAKKYTSDISQADADQKALDDISTNGQNEANSSPCIYSGCNITAQNGITLSASSYITQPTYGHFNATLNLVAPNNTYWYNNSAGNIPATCRPTSTRVINNVIENVSKTIWKITINTDGSIILTPSITTPGPNHGGTAVAGKGASFTFEYDKN